MYDTFQDIIVSARKEGPSRLAFILPGKEEDIASIRSATDIALVHPVFIGTTRECEGVLTADIHPEATCETIDSPDTDAALSAALRLMKEDRADILMQGNYDQQRFFDGVCRPENGLMQGKLVSCLALFQSSPGAKGFIITDSYINNYPSLREKQQIVNQAIELARILDIDTPKIAALAAIEQVNPKIQSTVDSAILSKMSERGQFGKAVIDGPIDIDCALAKVAARRKGLESMVTGDVDIYLVPDVESGYSFVETLVFIGRMSAISVLMGTIKPVILTMPFVLQKNRVAEIALASLISHENNKQ